VDTSNQTEQADQAEETRATASEAEDKVADSLEGLQIAETPEQNSHSAEEKEGNDSQKAYRTHTVPYTGNSIIFPAWRRIYVDRSAKQDSSD
jgi:hypothetical protein